jgi:hypothetical protein
MAKLIARDLGDDRAVLVETDEDVSLPRSLKPRKSR